MSALTGEPRVAAAGGGAGSRMVASSSEPGTMASVSHCSDRLTWVLSSQVEHGAPANLGFCLSVQQGEHPLIHSCLSSETQRLWIWSLQEMKGGWIGKNRAAGTGTFGKGGRAGRGSSWQGHDLRWVEVQEAQGGQGQRG